MVCRPRSFCWTDAQVLMCHNHVIIISWHSCLISRTYFILSLLVNIIARYSRRENLYHLHKELI